MKKKLSISIEERKISKIEDFMKDGQFRNKSHVIEFAVDKLIREKENDQEKK